MDPLSLADDDFTNFAFSIAWYNPSHLLVRPLLRMRKLREFARVATPSQLLQHMLSGDTGGSRVGTAASVRKDVVSCDHV